MIWLIVLYVISTLLCLLSNIYRYNLSKKELESMKEDMYRSKERRKGEIATEVLIFGVIGFMPIINTILFLGILFFVIMNIVKELIEDSL